MRTSESIRSLYEVTGIAIEAGKLIVADALGKIDTMLANAMNGPEDEC